MAKVGRPTNFTHEVLQKLEDAFSWGCTDSEACCYANISVRSLYDYCAANEAFSHRKEQLKDMPTMRARRIIDASLKDNDLNTANRVIDRKEGQKIKQDITSGGKQINTWIVNPVTTEKDG